MSIGIKAIEYFLPEKTLSNDELFQIYGDWTAEKIFSKIGVSSRHISAVDECASDLAEGAANKLFKSNVVAPEDIDFILLATQSPDYLLPTTACILQDKLKIPKTAGALDFNLGCSAYIYGLALATSLVKSRIARNVLFITAETYTKYIDPSDRSLRTIFGDAAAATLVCENAHELGAYDFGTDGNGKDALIVPAGGARTLAEMTTQKQNSLFMHGTNVFNFAIEVVPQSIKNILLKHNLELDDIDLFIFHQANKFMLNFLRKKIRIPQEKFYINMEDLGNTVSSTIPIALKRADQEGKLKLGDKVLLIGFGVGLSWGSTILTW